MKIIIDSKKVRMIPVAPGFIEWNNAPKGVYRLPKLRDGWWYEIKDSCSDKPRLSQGGVLLQADGCGSLYTDGIHVVEDSEHPIPVLEWCWVEAIRVRRYNPILRWFR